MFRTIDSYTAKILAVDQNIQILPISSDDQSLDLIITKYASVYTAGVKVLMAHISELSVQIAKNVLSKCTDSELIDNVICGLTTEEVDEIVLDFNSKFREVYKDVFNEKYRQLTVFLDKMDKERQGKFSRHLIEDTEMRDAVDFTLKHSESRYAEPANKVNGQNILIIDDTIGRSQPVYDICNILSDSYAPNCITIIKLLKAERDNSAIDEYSLQGCESLESVVIPDGVTRIGCRLLEGCTNLKSVSIPDSVKVIGFYAFNACYMLKEIVIPPSVKRIEDHAFYQCRNLRVVTFTSSKIELYSAVFDDCKKLKKIIVPKRSKRKFVRMLGEKFADKIITQ